MTELEKPEALSGPRILRHLTLILHAAFVFVGLLIVMKVVKNLNREGTLHLGVAGVLVGGYIATICALSVLAMVDWVKGRRELFWIVATGLSLVIPALVADEDIIDLNILAGVLAVLACWAAYLFIRRRPDARRHAAAMLVALYFAPATYDLPIIYRNLRAPPICGTEPPRVKWGASVYPPDDNKGLRNSSQRERRSSNF